MRLSPRTVSIWILSRTMSISTGSALAFVQDGEGDLLARVALDHLDGLAEAHVFGGFAVDFDDEVAGEDAGLVGGGAGHGAVHGQLAAVGPVVGDLDADAAKTGLALLVELLVFARIHVRRMGIEPFEAAVDHVLGQLALAFGVKFGDVLLIDFLEDVDEESDELVIFVVVAGGSAVGNGEGKQGNGGDTEKPVEIPARHVQKSSRVAAARGAGFTSPCPAGARQADELYPGRLRRGRRE